MTKSFAKKLTLLDEGEAQFTFQTFDDVILPDGTKRKDLNLTKIFHSTLEKYYSTLMALNQRDAGVFVIVNKTNLKGHKTGNIIGIRAIWQEADRLGTPSIPNPHIEVETSPGKYHRYVLIDEGTAPLNEFKAVQQRLFRDYGSDPAAADISLVLRLPGFFHNKNPAKSHFVRKTHTSGEQSLPWGEVKKLYHPVEDTKRSSNKPFAASPSEITSLRLAEIKSALDWINPDIEYYLWLTVLMAIHSEIPDKRGLEIANKWCAKGELYRPGEVEDKWVSFNQERNETGKVTIRSLFDLAYEGDDSWDGKIKLEHFLVGIQWLKSQESIKDHIKDAVSNDAG